MIDFVRFKPPEHIFDELGFQSFIAFNHDPRAVVIEASDVKELRSKLKKVSRKVIVGVQSNSISVLKEAVMRRKVDILLDSPDRELDYATLKLAVEKDVAVEFGLRKFIHARGVRRMRLFERLQDEVKVVNKLKTPFVISSAAESEGELRTRRQIETFFSFFGLDVVMARKFAEKIFRRYYDPSYIMDGFEIEVGKIE